MPYMICSSPDSASVTSARKWKKSLASHSKPSVCRPHSANVESRIQEKR